MALVLTGLGVTSPSMSPHRVPLVRYALSRHSLDRCRALADAALAADSAVAAHAAVRQAADPELTELL